MRIGAKALRKALSELLRRGQAYRLTRGMHSAALCTAGGRLLCLREDVGRHNALDKVLGWAAAQCVEPRKSFVAMSGRMSVDAVYKLARFRIPVAVSKGVPTSLAVAEAERLQVALAGALGAGGLRLFTHRELIVT